MKNLLALAKFVKRTPWEQLGFVVVLLLFDHGLKYFGPHGCEVTIGSKAPRFLNLSSKAGKVHAQTCS